MGELKWWLLELATFIGYDYCLQLFGNKPTQCMKEVLPVYICASFPYNKKAWFVEKEFDKCKKENGQRTFTAQTY